MHTDFLPQLTFLVTLVSEGEYLAFLQKSSQTIFYYLEDLTLQSN